MKSIVLAIAVIANVAIMQRFAAAHDLWLIPPATLRPGESLVIRCISGTEFPKGDRPPKTEAFESRLVRWATGNDESMAAAGIDKDAGLIRSDTSVAGLAIVSARTAPKIIELDADAFNHYLVSDGLSHIYQLRFKSDELNKPAVERYSKSPKAFVRIGDGPTAVTTKPIGLPLEIVPIVDPFSKSVGDALPVRVLFGGKPLANANLGWDHPGDGEAPAGTVRTDGDGKALIPLAKPGLITIRLTHITRPKAKNFEWESFWATLTWYHPEARNPR
jgi:uncharacterized GH25 family protein